MSTLISNKASIDYGESVWMETITCYKCGVPFAMPERLKRYFLDTKDSFYCPNGHSQAYVTSTEERLKKNWLKEKEEHRLEKERMETIINSVRNQRDKVIQERTVLKGKITKIKNRIKNGVCPCCNRTFSNLHNHMKSQHPDYMTGSADR